MSKQFSAFCPKCQAEFEVTIPQANEAVLLTKVERLERQLKAVHPSAVKKIKATYRQGSPVKRRQLRAWMKRVLANADGVEL